MATEGLRYLQQPNLSYGNLRLQAVRFFEPIGRHHLIARWQKTDWENFLADTFLVKIQEAGAKRFGHDWPLHQWISGQYAIHEVAAGRFQPSETLD